LSVAETEPLRPPPLGAAQRRAVSMCRQFGAFLDDNAHLVEEPRIPSTRVVNLFDRHAAPQQVADLEDALRCRHADRSEELLVGQRGVLGLCGIAVEPEAALLQRPQTLLQAL